jgi:cytochrome b subunit of formate dehydrogenase
MKMKINRLPEAKAKSLPSRQFSLICIGDSYIHWIATLLYFLVSITGTGLWTNLSK